MEDIVGLIAAFMGMLFFGGFALLYIGMFALIIGLLIFWIVMLVDCIKRQFSNENDKLVWILIVVLTGWVGALIYYFMVKRKDRSSTKTTVSTKR